jgi:hypothetical protein
LLTERDKEILRFISRFGYLCARHVIVAFPLSERVAYRRLQCLVQDGYLQRKRVLADLPRVYFLTQRGVDASGTDFGRVRNIRLQTLEHDLTVADVAVALMRLYPGSSWVTERELRRKAGQGFGSIGAREHVPDGVLLLPDGKKIAVEVETSRKPHRRTERILRYYLRRPDYIAVWYFCRTPQQLKSVKEAAQKLDFVKTHLLQEVLLDHENKAKSSS